MSSWVIPDDEEHADCRERCLRDGGKLLDLVAAVERMLDSEWAAWEDFAAERSVPLAEDERWRDDNRERMARLLAAAVGEGET